MRDAQLTALQLMQSGPVTPHKLCPFSDRNRNSVQDILPVC